MTRAITFGPLRVEFLPRGDRIAHTIYVVERGDGGGVGGGDGGGGGGDSAGVWRPLLHSVESEADAAWPESPPLQELHVEERDGRSVALLVGRAGKSHWSASIGREFGQNGGDALVFDVACRVSSRPQRLGSAYELAEGVAWMGERVGDTNIISEWRSIVLHPDPGKSGSQWQLAVDATARLIAVGPQSRLGLRPSDSAESYPATLRWRYTLRRG